MTAIARFDPARGTHFSTYAWWWVRQTISRAIGNLERPIRLPIHRIEAIKRFRRALDHMVVTLGRAPSMEELSICTGQSAGETSRLLSDLLDVFIDVDEDDQLAGDSMDPVEEEIIGRSLGEETRRFLALLSPREEQILRMRFAIGYKTDRTLEEVGKVFSVTRERIRQIEDKALEKLRSLYGAPSRRKRKTNDPETQAKEKGSTPFLPFQAGVSNAESLPSQTSSPSELAHLGDS